MIRKQKSLITIAVVVTILLITFFLPLIRSLLYQTMHDDFIEEVRDHALSANIKIVQIKYRNDESGGSISVSAGASGAIFHKEDNKYYALTAEHVVAEPEHADKTEVIILGYDDLDFADYISKGGKYQGIADYYQQFPKAAVEYSDDKYDLAIVSFTSDKAYAALPIADDLPKYGNIVASMGNPYRKRNVITAGKVSSRKPRPFGWGAGNMQYPVITHTSVISGGSSGGALLNKNLEIVGINIGGRENIFRQYRSGMAMPSNSILEFLEGVRLELFTY